MPKHVEGNINKLKKKKKKKCLKLSWHSFRRQDIKKGFGK